MSIRTAHRLGLLARYALLWMVSGVFVSPALAESSCKLAQIVQLSVTTSGLTPLVTAKVNGQEVQFIADSGAWFSMISAVSATQLQLPLRPIFGLYVIGVGGRASVMATTVKEFNLANIPFRNVDFLVGGSDVQREAVGVIGQNVFSIGDVEYDLAKGVIRIIKAKDCKKPAMAYWSQPGDSFSMLEVDWTTPLKPHTTGVAFLNGEKIHVMFDTGASTSLLSLKAAARAGITPTSEGVTDAGMSSGFGSHWVKSYIGRFASFSVGGEEIKNARLRFGDTGIEDADMLVGADFFLSHHVYVSASQHRMYFTYNGGPVFNLKSAVPQQAPAQHEPIGDALPGATIAEASAPDPAVPPLADAPAYSRRGSAFASRKDFDHALADFSHAVELDPAEASYRFQRAGVYWERKDAAAGLADLDKAIELKPDFASARLTRADYRLFIHQKAAALEDLDEVDRVLPKEADLRFALARAYDQASRLDKSVEQLTTWISFHEVDVRYSEALSQRCEFRALLGVDLPKALSDCDKALRLAAKGSAFNAHVLRNRGLVRLRQEDYARSVTDFDAAIKLDGQDPWSFYGRGLDYVREKKLVQANADLAQAKNLRPQIADTFSRYGMTE